jgi:hypothetical protein
MSSGRRLVKEQAGDCLTPEQRLSTVDNCLAVTSIPTFYKLLILGVLLLATATQVIRIVNVRSSTGEMPFLSANDRSRWCTILALVAGGTYVIDDVIEIRDPKTNRRTWNTIDRIQHRGSDGRQHFYSSKPPLLSTLYAGIYWGVRGITGATLTGQPFTVVRWMLLIVNLAPLMLLWWIMLQWACRYGLEPWQLLLLAIFVGFGTFLSTFVITLNNHLPAAVAAGISLACLQRILMFGDSRWGWFVGCGLATSFVAVNELPALAWLAVVGALLMWFDFRRACLAYLPALLPAAIAFFGTNYLAHGTLRPPYAMRDLGRLITTVAMPEDAMVKSGDGMSLDTLDIMPIIEHLSGHAVELSPETIVQGSRRPDVWQLWDETTQRRLGLKLDTHSRQWQIYHWGDWYDYPDTYWTAERKQGVDRGEPSRIRYAFHCLIGHHGIFSLTPFWIFSLLGAWVVARKGWLNRAQNPGVSFLHDGQWLMMAAIILTSAAVIGFYLMRPLEDRNYGGVTSGLRWTFWLIPLWYWLAIRGLDRADRLSLRCLLIATLAISVYSATVPWGNPWTSPWLTQWFPL